jgi:hypothetical protein
MCNFCTLCPCSKSSRYLTGPQGFILLPSSRFFASAYLISVPYLLRREDPPTLTDTMEWKHVLLLWLSIHTASALSLDNVLNQINSYIASPLSLFQSSEGSDSSACDYSSSSSCRPKRPIHPETYPCCVCGKCTCSHTSCPFIVPFPGPPTAHWPVNASTPIDIATAGCGANYTLNACLRFVLQYFDALEPALERASNHSHSHYSEDKEKKKKVPCCGDGCSDSQCLKYLAVTVKNLQAPINGTLEAGGRTTADESEQQKEEHEALKSEL